MKIKGPTKGLKTICERLGSPYSIRVFDFEQVIYRDFGNGYDLEVSRLNHNRKDFNATVYVWNTKKPIVVESFPNIDSFEKLSDTLSEIEAKYSAL